MKYQSDTHALWFSRSFPDWTSYLTTEIGMSPQGDLFRTHVHMFKAICSKCRLRVS